MELVIVIVGVIAAFVAKDWKPIPIGVACALAVYLLGLVHAPGQIYERLRADRARLRDKALNAVAELEGIKEHIIKMRERLYGDDVSVWANAGGDLIEARKHGLWEDSKYVALRTILDVAEQRGHP